MAWEQPLHLEWQANSRASHEAVRSEGIEEIPLSFTAPSLRVSFRVPIACDFSPYSLNGELTRRLEIL